jgi:hypothetical protein
MMRRTEASIAPRPATWEHSVVARHRLLTRVCVAGVTALLLVGSVMGLTPSARATPAWRLSAGAPCAALAAADPSATNGASWGRTILPGHNAPGGWFGVDVCANGINAVAPNGANVSCDRVPANWARSGCAPGGATSDGFGLTFQCVELIIRFAAWAYGDSPDAWGRSGWGNAPDLWLPQNHPSDFVMYPNGSSHAPVPGDLIVWGSLDAQDRPWPAGPTGQHDGHIAVVAGVRHGMVITAEENVLWGTDDHPSDLLALTHVGSHWILSGSQAHTTTLPTYRWQSTMGTTRATYGWLHSVRNHGSGASAQTQSTHPATTPASTRPAAMPTPAASTPIPAVTPELTTASAPLLDSTMLVTTSGTLADLVWSRGAVFASTGADGPPQAQVRTLGHPPQTLLAANGRASAVVHADGSRDCYVVGADGNLYDAQTGPRVLGVLWSELGAPPGRLRSSPAALMVGGALYLVATGRDGALWMLTSAGGRVAWQTLGHPSAGVLSGAALVVATPGLAAPLAVALGQGGLLYARPLSSAPSGPQGWSAVHIGQPGVRIAAPPLLASAASAQAGGTVAPVNLLALDTHGGLWWLRPTERAPGWTAHAVTVPARLTALLGAAVTPVASGSAPVLTLYARTAHAAYQLNLAAGAPGVSPAWMRLAPLPAGVPQDAVGSVVPVGAGSTALVLPAPGTLLLGGTRAALAVLAPSGESRDATASTGGWRSLSGLTGASSFDAALTTVELDPRWAAAGAWGASAETPTGLRLAGPAAGTTALLQAATAGDAGATALLTVAAGTPGDISAGVAEYLDASDWITLAVEGGGQVRLCAMVGQKALPCTTARARVPPGMLWLTLFREGSTFTGAYSTDGLLWHTVGILRASDLLATGQAGPGGVVAPLAFTEWGIFTAGVQGFGHDVTFTRFAVEPTPGGS